MAKLTQQSNRPAGERPVDPGGRDDLTQACGYQDDFRRELRRLLDDHRNGGGGREICQARALVADRAVQRRFASVQTRWPLETTDARCSLALVATGGYGRGELNPFSDADLIVLFAPEEGPSAPDRALPWLAALEEELLQPLGELGLPASCALRSVDECVRIAIQDPPSTTALLEARYLAGDRDLFLQLESRFLASCVHGQADAYLRAQFADQEARRARYGDSPTMLEPNLKNGCGGLRDYQDLLWRSFFKHRIRTLAELADRGWIHPEERAQLEAAYDALLRVRTELHYQSDRASDVLARASQPAVARQLGYAHRSPTRRIEDFLGDLYLHMRHVHLITRALEQRLALRPPPSPGPSGIARSRRPGPPRVHHQVLDGFELVDGEIVARTAEVFAEEPRRLLRMAFYAQQRGLRLHSDLAQLARQHLALVDSAFRTDAGAAETFLALMAQRGNVAPAVRALHETGVLGRYLPEFGALTCLVRHEFYHQYTVDEHTLRCLEHLDRVWEAKTAPYQAYTEALQELDQPGVLYLALLLHDTGKARHDRDHTLAGVQLARQVAERLRLDAAITHNLCWLIEHHLLMAQVSQRRDLDDPAVIRAFAHQVRSPELLRMLTLHTLADSLGTGPNLWNGFKDSLLRRLFHQAARVLAGSDLSLQAREQQHAQLLTAVRALVTGHLEEDELVSHFTEMPVRYFLFHQPEEIATDLRLVHRFLLRQVDSEADPLVPILDWEDEPDRGCTQFKVCTWDRPGLFGKIAGALTAVGLNILGARIFTRGDSIILDTFTVTDARTGHLAAPAQREQCELLLTRVLTGDQVDLGELIARRPVLPPLHRSFAGERLSTTVHFDNTTSETCTVVDLETEDHLGLLYHVADELASRAVDITLARVNTERGAAVDTFYVTDTAGHKLVDPEQQAEIRACLLQRIAALPEPLPG